MIYRFMLRSRAFRAPLRSYSKGSGQSQGSTTSAASAPPPTASVPEVPGLSASVVAPASQPVGPGVDPNKSGAYKVPEYFCYNNMSYFEAEIEMAKFRLPQPSAVQKK